MGNFIYVKGNKYKLYALRIQKADILRLQGNYLMEKDYLQAKNDKTYHKYPTNCQNFLYGQSTHTFFRKLFSFGILPTKVALLLQHHNGNILHLL